MRGPLFAMAAVGALMLTFASGTQQIPDRDTTPIAPQIPGANRNDASKVFLEHANELKASPDVDYQILTGDVAFRRDGMFMWCDSAHFYDATGSFDAFGNIRMEQGDTLFIYGDTLKYDEPLKLATLIASPGRRVKLINRDVTLRTDEFNYDLGLDVGYYETGGELTDKQNRLTSTEGEYSPTTKEAVFRDNVHLTSLSKSDTLQIFSDNLYYNTLTHVALLVAQSTVVNRDGTIVTSNGVYNTETTQSELYDHSTVTYRNGNTLTGDTLFYNRESGLGEAFGNVEINDTTNHVLLRGEYGYAYEPADSAYVTGRAYAIEYSSADSLFLHGDTVRTFRRFFPVMEMKTVALTPAEIDSIAAAMTANLDVEENDTIAMPEIPTTKEIAVERTDTVRFLTAAPRVRFYRRDIQGLCDSMTMVSTDSMLYMDRYPIVWSDNRQISGDQIKIKFNDSTAENATVTQNAFMAELIEDIYFNQLSGKEMFAILKNGSLSHLDVNGNVLAITYPEESDSTINKMMSIESSFLAADFTESLDIEHMKLWSETNATVTPLYLAKRSQLYLPNFRWLERFRPLSAEDIFNFTPELIEALDNAVTLQTTTQPWKQNQPTQNSSSSFSTNHPATSMQSTPSSDDSTHEDSPNSTQENSGTLNEEEDITSPKTDLPSSPSLSAAETQPKDTE